MSSHTSIFAELGNGSARGHGSPDVQGELLEFSRTVGAWQTPSEVLDALHHATHCMSAHLERSLPLSAHAVGSMV